MPVRRKKPSTRLALHPASTDGCGWTNFASGGGTKLTRALVKAGGLTEEYMALLKSLSIALTAALLVTVSAPATWAQEEMTAEEIAAKLKKPKLTRSLKKDKNKDELDAILSRSIGVVERKKIVELTEKAELPRLDFSITFGFDSADIDTDSYRTLDTLAEALKSDALYESQFLINGHTDSKGSDDYNLELSQRRANSVVAYLVSKHDVAPERLKAIGFGETSLKDVNDGEASDNRRVEIVNRP
jgi:outer membrane protein OmpA-like peptidoglycan-associated protein